MEKQQAEGLSEAGAVQRQCRGPAGGGRSTKLLGAFRELGLACPQDM